MKACIIQPAYSTDYSASERYFEEQLKLIDSCDESMDIIVLPEMCDIPCLAPTKEEADLSAAKFNEALLAKVARIHDEIISLLPSGKADLNYYDLYMELITSGRYNRYSDICRHVAEVRRKDEAARQLREIKLRQIRIEQQNKLMLEQQRELKKQLSDMETEAQRRHRESQRAIHELSKQIEREADYFYTYTSMFL